MKNPENKLPSFLNIKNDKENNEEAQLIGGGDLLVSHNELTPGSIKKMEEEEKKAKEIRDGSTY